MHLPRVASINLPSKLPPNSDRYSPIFRPSHCWWQALQANKTPMLVALNMVPDLLPSMTGSQTWHPGRRADLLGSLLSSHRVKTKSGSRKPKCPAFLFHLLPARQMALWRTPSAILWLGSAYQFSWHFFVDSMNFLPFLTKRQCFHLPAMEGARHRHNL